MREQVNITTPDGVCPATVLRPDLAEVLYEPFPYDFRGEQAEGGGFHGRFLAQRKPSAVVVFLAWSEERSAPRMKAA